MRLPRALTHLGGRKSDIRRAEECTRRIFRVSLADGPPMADHTSALARWAVGQVKGDERRDPAASTASGYFRDRGRAMFGSAAKRLGDLAVSPPRGRSAVAELRFGDRIFLRSIAGGLRHLRETEGPDRPIRAPNGGPPTPQMAQRRHRPAGWSSGAVGRVFDNPRFWGDSPGGAGGGAVTSGDAPTASGDGSPIKSVSDSSSTCKRSAFFARQSAPPAYRISLET